jgi:hypothetical protein
MVAASLAPALAARHEVAVVAVQAAAAAAASAGGGGATKASTTVPTAVALSLPAASRRALWRISASALVDVVAAGVPALADEEAGNRRRRVEASGSAAAAAGGGGNNGGGGAAVRDALSALEIAFRSLLVPPTVAVASSSADVAHVSSGSGAPATGLLSPKRPGSAAAAAAAAATSTSTQYSTSASASGKMPAAADADDAEAEALAVDALCDGVLLPLAEVAPLGALSPLAAALAAAALRPAESDVRGGEGRFFGQLCLRKLHCLVDAGSESISGSGGSGGGGSGGAVAVAAAALPHYASACRAALERASCASPKPGARSSELAACALDSALSLVVSPQATDAALLRGGGGGSGRGGGGGSAAAVAALLALRRAVAESGSENAPPPSSPSPPPREPERSHLLLLHAPLVKVASTAGDARLRASAGEALALAGELLGLE